MRLLTEFSQRFKLVFSVDLRALAAFRIALALLILANLFILAFDLPEFFTDSGIMPRRLWPLATDRWHWSLHASSGQTWFQVLLFVVSAGIAVLLGIGYRTRLMSILSWVLLVSLVNRNHFILQAGDQLLVILAFWAMFLPLNARFSVDSALDSRLRDNPNRGYAGQQSTTAPNQHFSIATIAVILQVLYLYFFTALLKTGDPWRVSMDAAFYAVSLEHFATPVAVFMRDFPGLLSVATGYVLLVEFTAPLLAMSPIFHTQLRILAILTLYSLHIGFLLMLHIGLFPFIDFAALLLLVPAFIWNSIGRRLGATRRRSNIRAIRIYYDQGCGFCRKTTLILREFLLDRAVRIEPAQADAEMGPVLTSENSWIVTDHTGQKYLHWEAVRFVISQRYWLRPLAWCMKLPVLMRLGHRLYQHIGANRMALSEYSARWLPYRPVRLNTTLPIQLVAAFFLYAVTCTNIASVKSLQLTSPEHVSSAIKLARLDQRWGMFAPKPLVYSLYPAVVGELRDGNTVDLFNNRPGPPQWNPADIGYAAYPGYRWRKIFERVDGDTARVRGAYGDFLCRRWNHRSRARESQLATLEIFSVRRRTNTDGLPKAVSQHSLWRHWCYPEFAPDA